MNVRVHIFGVWDYHGDWRKEVIEMLFLPHEEGQGLVEYALILVLIAIVVIAILLLVGPVIGNVFSAIVDNL
jgi:pilus assembly protein Flp/PilA